jgi:hypothetical protein
MPFWFDDDANKRNTRVLWQWGVNSTRFQLTKPDKDKPLSRRARENRSRALAEMVEGVPPHSDQDDFGRGPFGRLTLGLFSRRPR